MQIFRGYKYEGNKNKIKGTENKEKIKETEKKNRTRFSSHKISQKKRRLGYELLD